MNTHEQNKTPDQEKVTNVAPDKGSDKNQPVKEPTEKAKEGLQSKSAS